MSAQDNLSPGQFYHASPHKIAPGTIMTPETNAAHGPNFDQSSGNTYFTSDLRTAENMGRAAGNGVALRKGGRPRRYYVYDVEPTGYYSKDSHPGVRHSYESSEPVKVLGRHEYGAGL